jgi:hypothetical protein
MILTVPHDQTLYPTLGPQVCGFMEENLVFGPGDLRGQPLVLGDEWRALIYRMYEVFPPGHPQAGRRRFRRCGISLAKGQGKTELAAFITACELHPEAPVRCTGWTPGGEPIGGPVNDPYIPLVAYTEEQSDELCYGALLIILQEGPMRDDFDIGLQRILRKKGDGKAVSLSSSPDARDGARTTFMVMDETHRWTLPRLREAHKTMMNNLAKRKIAQPWMLEITTAPEPGEGSVAEATMDYAKHVDEGRTLDTSLFFFHRQSSDHHDLSTPDGRRAAVIEASGASAEWRDIDAIVAMLDDPGADVAYWERVWCNRLVKGATQAFNIEHWKTLKAKENPCKPGDAITIGFDGAKFHDSTGFVATHLETGFQWVPGVWECPPHQDPEHPWQVPADEVDQVVHDLFDRFTVVRMYADPPYWQDWVSKWIGEFGKERVVEWWTNRRRQMAAALEGFQTALRDTTGKRLSHDGDKRLQRHLGNARKEDLPGWRDEQGKALWLIRKERPDSPHKMDLAMAAVLSWEARMDAIAAGALNKKPERKYQMLIMGARH